MEQFTQRVFGLPSKEFFPRHSDVLVALRHLLVPAVLKQHAAQLAELAQQQLSRWPTGKKVCVVCGLPCPPAAVLLRTAVPLPAGLFLACQ